VIADHLDRYYEVETNLRWEVVRSIVVDGHEAALMRFTGHVVHDITGRDRDGEPFEGLDFKCECDFTEGVGWRVDEKHGVTRLGFECRYARAARELRYLELRQEYLDRYDPRRAHTGITDGNFELIRHAKEIIPDLVRRAAAGEWLGEKPGGASFYGGYFYLQTAAEIMGTNPGILWDAAYELVAERKIGLDGAVVKPYSEPPPPRWVEHMRAEEDGWTVVASLPGHRDMPSEWKLEVLRPGGEPAYRMIPALALTHDPIFGPDVEDVARMEERLGELFDAARARADA
jgi:hypothetical protein